MALTRLPRPSPARAGNPELRLALLADAHLKNGDPGRADVKALARALAEIKALRPAPDLVLFAGDLAHRSHPHALALGKEILSDLSAPLLLVRGEGDGRNGGATAWESLFGEPKFSYTYRGINIIGLDPLLTNTGRGRAFVLGEGGRRFLAQELNRLDPALPLVVLSHAPLAPVFRPWGQWTADAGAILPLLAPIHRALCLHGHVHHSVASDQQPVALSLFGQTSPQFPHTENLLSIPAAGSVGVFSSSSSSASLSRSSMTAPETVRRGPAAPSARGPAPDRSRAV